MKSFCVSLLAATAVSALELSPAATNACGELYEFSQCIVDYDDFSRVFPTFEFCVRSEKDFSQANKVQCDKIGGKWAALSDYFDDNVYGGLTAASDQYSCSFARKTSDMYQQPTKMDVWLLRVKDKQSHKPEHILRWNALLSSPVGNFATSGKDLYIIVNAAANEVDKLLETGQFSHSQALPFHLKISPQILINHARHPDDLVDYVDFSLEFLSGSVDVDDIQTSLSSSSLVNAAHEPYSLSFESSHQASIHHIHSSIALDLARHLSSSVSSLFRLHVDLTYSTGNNDASTLLQSGSTADADASFWNHGITGTGQIVGVGDTGIDELHCYFYDANNRWAFTNGLYENANNRKVVQYVAFASAGENEVSGHGSHVSGTVAGNSITGQSTADNGVAKDAKLTFFDIGVPNAASLNVPSAMDVDYFPLPYSAGARIHSNSWGSTPNTYTSRDQAIDRYTYNNQDFLVLFAAGNSGSGPGTLGTPATGKNVMSIGASTNTAFATMDLATFSSRGPAFDGRIKPDVVAPGASVTSSNSQAAPTAVHCGTIDFQGTSMATPATAGVSALMRQYFTDGFYPTGAAVTNDQFTPMASLVKALLVNSAQYLTGTQANLHGAAGLTDQGFGFVVAETSVYFADGSAGQNIFVDGEFSTNCGSCSKITGTGQQTVYRLTMKDNAVQPLRVTLVWYDVAASTASAVALINDLDLIVVPDQTGVAVSINFVTAGEADSLNTVETAYIDPADTASYFPGGSYTITVEGQSIVSTTPYSGLPYSIVISGDFVRDSSLFPDHAPSIDSGVANEQGEVVLTGDNLGTDLAAVIVTATCNSPLSAIPAYVTGASGSNLAIKLNSTSCMSSLTIEVENDNFYGISPSINVDDSSIANECDDYTPAFCSSVPDCEVNPQTGKCGVSEGAIDRGVSLTGNNTQASDVGLAIGLMVMVVSLILIVLAVVWRRREAAAGDNTTGAFMRQMATSFSRQKPVVKASTLSEGRAPPPPSVPGNKSSLPENWVTIMDPSSGDFYYWNQVTGITSWERPTDRGFI